MTKKLIIWADKYSVGYDEIDNQHKKLVEMINDLHISFTEGKTDKLAEGIVKKMIEYTDYHFKTEEKYFEKYNYSETQLHIEQHLSFVKQVTTFYDEFKKGNVTITYDIMNFL
ncbi:MAG: bacteriohemerythrin [Bacteroidota bacterium]|nr:bacteriohemerythrin [Bacteroidota bacterium]